MLMRLSAELVSGQMISLAVGNGGGLVGMGRQVVELRSSIVGTLRHRVLLICRCHPPVEASLAGLACAAFLFLGRSAFACRVLAGAGDVWVLLRLLALGAAIFARSRDACAERVGALFSFGSVHVSSKLE
jgi:hypothetical protein